MREHVMQKVGRFKLNQDIVGQSIETIECELNLMQTKLEEQFAMDQNANTFGQPIPIDG